MPVPFEAALQNDARTAASEIKTHPKIDAEDVGCAPVAAKKELMDFRLCPRGYVDAFDLA